MLSSDSGHYAPEPLDMYRGIKRMQELMPNAFTPDAKIKYYDKSGSHSMNIRFIEMMDRPGIDNKPLHQELRDKRV